MFDIGFSELCLIALVSLLVIGPERLPKVARLAGFWLGKTRNMVASVKEEIKMELQAEELRQIFKEQSDLQDDFLNIGKNAIAETQQLLDETSSDTFKTTLTSPSIDNPEPHEPK
jgi:sec-independent protein translocase protein TatB